jgi:thiosulfate dehydrogenase
MRLRSLCALCASFAGALGGCGQVEPARANTTLPIPPSFAALDSLPDNGLSRAIRRGHALVLHPRDSLPEYTESNLNCTSCHLDHGLRQSAIPLTAAFARYPRFMDRTDSVASLEDRVNYCFTRSLAGQPIPVESRAMRDIVAYLAFLSRGVTLGNAPASVGSATMPKLSGDSARGHALFTSTCTRCHGVDGAGALYPALWGEHSFGIGASMAREERAAAFIRHNMPYDGLVTLTDQQAFDVAAFITSQPRPDLAAKENDWPAGGAPYDVPYDTKQHAAFHPPPVLVRPQPALTRTAREPRDP